MATNYNAADTNSVKVEVETTLGSFTVLLYGDTPRHRDNFVKLVKEGYYNGTLFHRVINEFMVQAGDPDSKTAAPGQQLGAGGPDYTIDAEFVFPKHFHKRGALAAARQGDQVNPTKASSGSQFYIVTGKKVSENELGGMEKYLEQSALQSRFSQLAQAHMTEVRDMQAKGDQDGLQKLQQELIAEAEAYVAEHPVKVTDEMKQAYTTVGGTPHLDNNYTVFGEVISGMETVDKIEKVETDRSDRPKEDVRIISMKIVD
ncbi:MAG: peptidylprolyl isomerase [Muribaculaceae bacterium]|nr:peptidylprolyl isomerase [Muribaculaceae bacterium]